MHLLIKKQSLPISIEQAWDFISSPRNLGKITPPSMDFRITSELDAENIYPGMMITYTVSPLLGIPLKWVSEITYVQAPHFFVDDQRHGPYSFWHHQHHLKEIPGGVEMIDRIHYGVPGWIFSGLINELVVKRQLEQLFAYREKKLEELFGRL